MKKCRRYVVRGTIPEGSIAWDRPVRIQLDNMDFTKNYKVVEWTIFPNMSRLSGNIGSYRAIPPATTTLTNVCLALEENAFANTGVFDFAFNDSRQIGWFQGYGYNSPSEYRAFLDPEHIVCQDLWLGGYEIDMADGSTEYLSVALNYHIVLEAVKSTNDQAVMQLIKQHSQDVTDN